MQLQYKAFYSTSATTPGVRSGNMKMNSQEDGKIQTRSENNESHKGKKNEIPKTKEVKIPSIEVPMEIIKTKKRLVLTIFESKLLIEGTTLNIHPGGLEGSERMSRDGIVLFGTNGV